MDDDDDDTLNLTDVELFDVTNVKLTSWESKDRTIVTLRMADAQGMCDMKIYLALKQKLEQMERLLNIVPGDDKEH